MKQKLRILFLLDFFSFFGGTEYINYNLIAGLKELGHDVKVCVAERLSFDTWADMIKKKDVELFVSEHPYDQSDSLDTHKQFVTEVVNKVIEGWKLDIIFSHPPGKLLIAFLHLHPILDIPVLAMEYTVPGENTKYWYHPELANVQERITAYIAKCEEAEEGLHRYYGYKGKIYRLPNLVSRPAAENADIKGELLSVGYIGRLSPEKGVGFLLGAWSLVVKQKPESKLYLYGHGLHEEYYNLLTDDLGIRENVSFESTFLPITGIEEIAAKHRIFVQPSLFESIPNSLIEIALRKKAVVASNVGGIPELVCQDKGEGILVPPGSTDMLSGGILRLMNDEQQANSMAKKLYEHAASLYDYDSNMLCYEKTLTEVVNDFKGVSED